MRRRLLLPLILAAAIALQTGLVTGAAIPSWTSYRHDAAGSGLDPDSTTPATLWRSRSCVAAAS
jgi:hypothetical protein